MSVYRPQFFNDRRVHENVSTNYPHLFVVKDRGETSDWKDEVVHWFDPINFYVYLWQPVRIRNRIFTTHSFFKTAFRLPHFPTLWDNICKGSFAYNTFLFRKPAFSKNYNNTFLADLTCLALLFGDEFIDGICQELGKEKVQQVLKENGNEFYLKISENPNGHELEYSFDLYYLLPGTIWKLRNEKYGIDYKEFYELLKTLLDLMNHRLGKMNQSMAKNAAIQIKEACNLCFDTFIHDVKDIPVQWVYKGRIPPSSWHEKKNRSIQLKLLELRCVLLGKKIERFEKKFTGWLDIISTMQVYDDMQDCRGDEHFQDNLLLAFASGNFPEEMEWFHQNKNRSCDDEQWRLEASLHMPCSVYLCTKFTKDRMVRSMNWVQKKICNYLWKNNWFNPVHNSHQQKNFEEVLEKTFPVFTLTKSETEWKSYAIEICFHNKQLRKYILSKASLFKRYFLYFNFLHMSSFEKTELAEKIILSHVTDE
ncbi:MAG TPA: hypothetical protein VFP97_08645 [Chitinophagaceae bacterium]|nr:hypothetical protein [Chitinophagaceae bacterium]